MLNDQEACNWVPVNNKCERCKLDRKSLLLVPDGTTFCMKEKYRKRYSRNLMVFSDFIFGMRVPITSSDSKVVMIMTSNELGYWGCRSILEEMGTEIVALVPEGRTEIVYLSKSGMNRDDVNLSKSGMNRDDVNLSKSGMNRDDVNLSKSGMNGLYVDHQTLGDSGRNVDAEINAKIRQLRGAKSLTVYYKRHIKKIKLYYREISACRSSDDQGDSRANASITVHGNVCIDSGYDNNIKIDKKESDYRALGYDCVYRMYSKDTYLNEMEDESQWYTKKEASLIVLRLIEMENRQNYEICESIILLLRLQLIRADDWDEPVKKRYLVTEKGKSVLNEMSADNVITSKEKHMHMNMFMEEVERLAFRINLREMGYNAALIRTFYYKMAMREGSSYRLIMDNQALKLGDEPFTRVPKDDMRYGEGSSAGRFILCLEIEKGLIRRGFPLRDECVLSCLKIRHNPQARDQNYDFDTPLINRFEQNDAMA